MAGDAARHARIVDHRHRSGLRLACIEAAHGPFAGLAADIGRGFEIGEMQAGGIVVVTLHRGSLAGNDACRAREARAEILTDEAMRRRQHQSAEPGAGAAAAGIGDALDRKGGVFGSERVLFQPLRRNFGVVVEVEIADRSGQPRRVGETLIWIFRRHPRHRDGAPGELMRVGSGGRRDTGNALAHEHAQRNVVALRQFGRLDLAEPHGNAARAAAHRDRIGRVGASLPGGLDQRRDAIDKFGGIDAIVHGIFLAERNRGGRFANAASSTIYCSGQACAMGAGKGRVAATVWQMLTSEAFQYRKMAWQWRHRGSIRKFCCCSAAP